MFNVQVVLAPHDISENRVREIENLFSGKQKVIRYSKANEQNISEANVLIIDSIGMLSSLYKYGWVTYVGGGFGKGIHNILEAAVNSKPVFFGPNYQKAGEAKALIEKGGGLSVSNSSELKKYFEKFLKIDSAYSTSCEASRKYVLENTGATDKILKLTSRNFLSFGEG